MDAHRPSKPGGTRQEKAEVKNISSEFVLVFFVSRCDQNMFLPSAKRPEGRAARDTRQARQRLASIFKAVISDSENQVEQLCKLPCLTLRPIFTWGGSCRAARYARGAAAWRRGSGPDNVLQKLPSYSFYLSNLRPCYGPLFPARAKRAPPSAARASRAKEKGDHNMGAIQPVVRSFASLT